jgi:protease-4
MFMKKIFVVISILVFAVVGGYVIDSMGPFVSDFDANNFSSEDCSIARIDLNGYLSTYDVYLAPDESGGTPEASTSSDVIVASLKYIDEDPTIEGVIISVDSGGGSLVAGEEISNTLERMDKPSVAVVRDVAASAAYRAILGADRIIASANSSVGSIGVIYSYLETVKKNVEEGLEYREISSGRFKSIGEPSKTLTEEERALIQRDIDIMNRSFMFAVSNARGIPFETVALLADGSTMMGLPALQAGLIDALGGTDEALDFLSDEIGHEAKVCTTYWQDIE